MARATIKACMGFIATVALGGTAMAAILLGMWGLPLIMGQTRPALISAALNSGMECYRRGDYEQADGYFQQAQTGRDSLSKQSQDELDRYAKLNGTALQARKDGAAQLRKSETEYSIGHVAEAETLLKKLVANQFLTVEDRQKVKTLYEKIRPSPGIRPAGGGIDPTKTKNAKAEAEAKLQLARQNLNKGKFELAEALAMEAANIKGVTYDKQEDMPTKVLEDIKRLKKDAKFLMQVARAAFQRNEFEDAEKLAHMAEEAKRFWSPLGDNPQKLLKDVQIARGKGIPTKSDSMKKPWYNMNDTAEKKETADNPKSDVNAGKIETVAAKGNSTIANDDAHKVLQEARKELDAGHFEAARKLVAKARTMKATYLWWDTNSPDRVQADIEHAENAKNGTVAAKDPKTSAKDAALSKADPHTLVKEARDAYKAGKLDEAEKYAGLAKESALTGWGLFEDTPDKVLQDVRKVRAKRERDESVTLLIDARKHFEQGDLDKARNEAMRSERLHGSYNIWELGDRPSKLLAEIDAAETHKQKQPPVSALVKHDDDKPKQSDNATVVQNTVPQDPTPPKPTDIGTVRTPTIGVTPVPDDNLPPLRSPTAPASAADPRVTEARQILQKARVAVRDRQYEEAMKLATQVQAMKIVLDQPGEETPSTILEDVQKALQTQAAVEADKARQEAANEQVRTQARMILTEARRLQDEGRLGEARQKAVDAQKLGINLANEEYSPERILLELAGLASKRIEGLMQEAAELANTAATEPSRYNKAEDDLQQARQLALGFGLDTQPIDTRMTAVRQMRDGKMLNGSETATGPAPTGVTQEGVPIGGPSPAEQQGLMLLENARRELSAGNTAKARGFAEQAMSGPWGVSEQATVVLRSIDTEEYIQSRKQADRSFDAAMSAYLRNDKQQARMILTSLDHTKLSPEKQGRYKEIMRMPDMQPTVTQVGTRPLPGAATAKATDMGIPPAPAALAANETPLAKVAAMQEIKFQKMREESLRVQKEALERSRSGDYDRALEILTAYLENLRGDPDLDPQHMALLRRPVEARVEQCRTLKEYGDKNKQLLDRQHTAADMLKKKYEADSWKQQQVAEQMKLYHDLYKEGKYREAELAARKASELDPDCVAAAAAVQISQMAGNKALYDGIKENKEYHVLHALDHAEDEGAYVDPHNPIAIDREVTSRGRGRREHGYYDSVNTNEREREIKRRLEQPISFDFKDMKLSQVVESLADLSGVNVVAETRALTEEGISMDLPLTQKLEGISMKSALNILLDKVHLTYVVKNEVLTITTPKRAKGDQQKRTYSVADLVVPIDNFTQAGNADLNNVINKLNRQGSGFTSGVTPYTGPMSLNNGQSVGQPGTGTVSPGQVSMLGGGNPNAAASPNALASPAGANPKTAHQPGETMEGVLIDLIKNTIAPNSWSDRGGPGTIDYFPLGMALVVNQTPDIQEQIQELLQALRRLQDLEVTVEVRFITISESFYERIGVNFNVNVLTHTDSSEQQITSGVFAPPGFINNFEPSRFVTGLTPAGTFTHDLEIPISVSSFGPATPQFGGFPIAPGADGGLSLGLAFLSDIQVFLFLDAAQGDRRTNIMQAPKLTMFNAQTATIAVQDTVFFVTGNIIGLFNGQLVYSPQNQAFNIGLQLTMQPVVSADRRFVRISLAPTLTNISTPLAALFPFTTVVTPTFDTGVVGQPVPITQYLQQPAFTTISVQTTVSVPDGGTVLLGGLKTLQEERDEFGPPILDKMPYVNRLFKNTAYGRDAKSLMLMVTPRIIINEEEEERLFGRPGGG